MDKEVCLSKRIEELREAAQKVRLEAMRLAATIITKTDGLLMGGANSAPREAELILMRARYEGLVRTAEEMQTQVDRFQAEEHALKYLR